MGSDSRTFDWNTCTPFDDSSVSSGCDQVMVCQVTLGGGNPAGSKDTSFIVDSSGNVVISYGVMVDGGGHGRQVSNFRISLYHYVIDCKGLTTNVDVLCISNNPYLS